MSTALDCGLSVSDFKIPGGGRCGVATVNIPRLAPRTGRFPSTFLCFLEGPAKLTCLQCMWWSSPRARFAMFTIHVVTLSSRWWMSQYPWR